MTKHIAKKSTPAKKAAPKARDISKNVNARTEQMRKDFSALTGLGYYVDSPRSMASMINTRSTKAVVIGTLDTGATYLGYYDDAEAVTLAQKLRRMRKVQFDNVIVVPSDTMKVVQRKQPTAAAMKDKAATGRRNGPANGSSKWNVKGPKSIPDFVFAKNVHEAKRQVAAMMQMPRGWVGTWAKSDKDKTYTLSFKNSRGKQQPTYSVTIGKATGRK